MVAIPILTYFGHEVVPFPTVGLSSTTDLDSDPVALDTNKWLNSCVTRWKETSTNFDAIYTGWLGHHSQVDLLTQICGSMVHDKTVIFVDPVLGDGGELYPSQAEIAEKMPSIVCQADLITPNPTEASLLLRRKPQEYDIREDGTIPLPQAKSLAYDLSIEFPNTLSVVKSTTNGDNIGVVTRFTPTNTIDTTVPKTEYYSAQRIKSGLISGAGDTFISWLVGRWLSLENPSQLKEREKASLLQDVVERITSAIIFAHHDELKRMPFSRLFSLHS